MNVRAKCVNPECSMVGVEKSAGLAMLVMRSQVAAAEGSVPELRSVPR